MPEARASKAVVVEVPGARALHLRHLVLDFNGTLARDGGLLPGVRSRLRRLCGQFDVSILTADTFWTARNALRWLRLRVETVRTGADKRRFVATRDGIVAQDIAGALDSRGASPLCAVWSPAERCLRFLSACKMGLRFC